MAHSHFNVPQPTAEQGELYLAYWGMEACKPRHSFGPGMRDVYKVHFVHAGRGIIKVGQSVFRLEAGQAFLIFPGTVVYYEADGDDPWTYSWIAFRGTRAESLLSRSTVTKHSPVFPMDSRLMPNLFSLLNQIDEHMPARDLRLQMLLIDFLATLIETTNRQKLSPAARFQSNEYVAKALDIFHTRYPENITVSQLASLLRLDRKHFSFLFKNTVGLSPQQYLLHYRMNRAGELLAQGKYSVGEVAHSVGYQDPLLFSRMFKKIKGVSPKHYNLR